MATLKNLKQRNYYIRESNTNNSYLNLNGLDDVVGSGFHSFYIIGSEYLVKGSEIQFEIIDSSGNPVNINAIRSIRKGNARVVSFSIDKNVSNGHATLYVSAVLNNYIDSDGNIKSIPSEYQGTSNLLFTYNFTVDKDKNNSDDIIFRKPPKISITPTVKEVRKIQKKSITVSTGSGGSRLTGSIKTVEQISDSEYEIQFESDENTFNPEMGGGELRFISRKYIDDSGNQKTFSYETYDRYPTQNGYVGDIQYVYDKNTLKAVFKNPDISIFGSGQNIPYKETFIPESQNIIYEIDYRSIPNNQQTLIQQNTYADIILKDLETVSGDIQKVRIYTKSDSEGTNYSLAYEGNLNEQKSLLEVYDNFDIGLFNSSSKLTYWTASDATNINDNPTDITPEFILDESILLHGAVITGSNDVFLKNVEGNQLQKPLYSVESNTSFTLYRDIDYDISLNTAVENVIQNDTRLDVYISGSGIPGDAGNRFGELVYSFRTDSDKTWRSDKNEIKFNSDYTITDARLIFVVTSGKWHLSDIKVKPKISKGYSVGEYRTKIPLNVLRKNQDFDFKFEFFDAAGNKANEPLYKNNITFERPNLVIEGEKNLLTGSLYVGSNTGSGIHYGGYENAGSISSVGYKGFKSASTGLGPTGFLMFSGSVLPNSGDDYKGVGLELVAGTSSYFKYRTNPQELTVLTDKFFFGSDAQFISGSNGNIEISSSIFHLDPTNNILIISGTIQATYGKIGGFEITPYALTGSGFYLSGSATGNEYFISSSNFNIKANGDITGSSVLFDGGKIGGFDLLSNEIKSTNNNLRLKSSGEITGSRVLFTGGKVGGFTITNTFISSSNLIINSNGTISTTDFADGVRGWIISSLGNGSAQFENVKIRGTLRTTVFEKDTVNAVGGQLWIGNSTILSSSINSTESTMSVQNVSGFDVGEILLIKKVNNTGFNSEYVLIQSSSRYNPSSTSSFAGDLYVQRGYGAGLPTGSGITWISELAGNATNYTEGQVIVSTGKLNTGWILANANPNETYTPYIDIVERTGSGVYDYDLKARFGDLSGLSQTRLLGVDPNIAGFGLYGGNVFLEGGIRATFGNIGGFGISNNVLSGSTFFLSGSATGAEQFINSNDTFIVTADGNLTASNAFISGSVFADTGKIGDWDIIDGKISGSNITLDASGSLIYKTDQGPGSDPQAPGFSYLANEYYIDFTPKVTGSDSYYVKFGPNFSVDSSGNLIASGAKFEGTITASAGIIGGFIIGSSSLYSPGNNFFISGSAIGDEYFISSSNFNIKANGNVTGSSVLFDGGKIGGFDLLSNEIKSTNNNLRLKSSGEITGSRVLFTGGKVGGWGLSSTTLSSPNITLDSTNEQISIGDTTFGNRGIQLDIDSNGHPRLFAGTNRSYFRFENGSVELNNVSLKVSQDGLREDIFNPVDNKRVVLRDSDITYTTFEPNTTITILSGSDNVKSTITVPQQYTQGTISAADIAVGDIIDSDKPVSMIQQGNGQELGSLSMLGKKFITYNSRNFPVGYYVYSPFGDAAVTMSYDINNDGTFSSGSTSTTVNQYTVGSLATPSTTSTIYIKIESDLPVTVLGIGSGGDNDLLKPASTEWIHADLATATKIQGTSSADYYDDGSGLTHYYYSNYPFGVSVIGDAAGGDNDTGIPVDALGDTYIIPHQVNGYQITALEPTVIKAYAITSGGGKTLLDTIDLSTASKSNTGFYTTGSDFTGGNGISSTPMLFEGTAPFALRTNDSSDDEYHVFGYRRSQRNQYASSTTIRGDLVRTGKLQSTNWNNSTTGSLIDLDNGTAHLGGSGSNAALYFNGSNLSIKGNITANSLNINTDFTLGNTMLLNLNGKIYITGSNYDIQLQAGQLHYFLPGGSIEKINLGYGPALTGYDTTRALTFRDNTNAVRSVYGHSNMVMQNDSGNDVFSVQTTGSTSQQSVKVSNALVIPVGANKYATV